MLKRNRDYNFNNFNTINYDPEEFQRYIEDTYAQYKYDESYSEKTFNDMCNPDTYQLQQHQKFVAAFINPDTPFPGILIYHGLGSGKTCTAIILSEGFKYITTENRIIDNRTKERILIVAPKQVMGQYYKELKTQCPGQVIILGKSQSYVSEQNINRIRNVKTELEDPTTTSKQKHELDKMIKVQRKNRRNRIDKIYEIMGHEKFADDLFNDTDDGRKLMKRLKKDNTVLIIDEIQSLVGNGVRYKKLIMAIRYHAAPSLRVVLMSATPIVDKPYEIGLTLNLLRPRIPFPETQTAFENAFQTSPGIDADGIPKQAQPKSLKAFKYMCSGYISYFRGGNPVAYPEFDTIYVKSIMGSIQYKEYVLVVNREIGLDRKTGGTGFKQQKTYIIDISRGKIEQEQKKEGAAMFNKSLAASNISLPKKPCNGIVPRRKLTRDDQLNYLHDCVKQEYDKGETPKDAIQNALEVIGDYSGKFESIINLIQPSKGPVFIYSQFLSHGIYAIEKILSAIGYVKFNPGDRNPNNNYKRYASWTGETKDKNLIESIDRSFNELPHNGNEGNTNGKNIKIILGTKAIMQGVSLFNVEQVHICEPWWNEARVMQVMFRAIRFCSHKALPPDRRRVTVYKHISELRNITGATTALEKYTKQFGEIQAHKHLNFIGIDQYIYDRAKQKVNLVRKFEKAMKEASIDCTLNRYGNIQRLERVIGREKEYVDLSGLQTGIVRPFLERVTKGKKTEFVDHATGDVYEKKGNTYINKTGNIIEGNIFQENIDCNVEKVSISNFPKEVIHAWNNYNTMQQIGKHMDRDQLIECIIQAAETNKSLRKKIFKPLKGATEQSEYILRLIEADMIDSDTAEQISELSIAEIQEQLVHIYTEEQLKSLLKRK